MVKKKIGLEAEKWVATQMGGVLVPQSGALYGSLDVKTIDLQGRRFLIEVKATTKEEYRVGWSLWELVETRAALREMEPLLVIVFRRKVGKRGIALCKASSLPDFPIQNLPQVNVKDKSLKVTYKQEATVVEWKDRKFLLLPVTQLQAALTRK